MNRSGGGYGDFLMSHYFATESDQRSDCCAYWVKDAVGIARDHFDEFTQSIETRAPIGMSGFDEIISTLLPLFARFLKLFAV